MLYAFLCTRLHRPLPLPRRHHPMAIGFHPCFAIMRDASRCMRRAEKRSEEGRMGVVLAPCAAQATQASVSVRSPRYASPVWWLGVWAACARNCLRATEAREVRTGVSECARKVQTLCRLPGRLWRISLLYGALSRDHRLWRGDPRCSYISSHTSGSASGEWRLEFHLWPSYYPLILLPLGQKAPPSGSRPCQYRVGVLANATLEALKSTWLRFCIAPRDDIIDLVRLLLGRRSMGGCRSWKEEYRSGRTCCATSRARRTKFKRTKIQGPIDMCSSYSGAFFPRRPHCTLFSAHSWM
ncbi:hypothetical protein C8R45DRAFT_1044664 [Mycena sanguinolenta]|nr:hypothetical protein C8R45DRAFT_1044664 [Mycena sanguinolenta]